VGIQTHKHEYEFKFSQNHVNMMDIYIPEIKRLVNPYVILLWESIFEASKLSLDNPIKAYEYLKNIIALLPIRVKQKVAPKVKEFEKEMEKMKEETKNTIPDSIIAKKVFEEKLKTKLKKFIRKALNIISNELEKMGLEYQEDKIPVSFMD